MKQEPRYYIASDYAGLVTGNMDFYYGYEHTKCEHGNDKHDCECEKDWCFVAKRDGAEVMRLTTPELKGAEGKMMEDYLLQGLVRFGEKHWRSA